LFYDTFLSISSLNTAERVRAAGTEQKIENQLKALAKLDAFLHINYNRVQVRRSGAGEGQTIPNETSHGSVRSED